MRVSRALLLIYVAGFLRSLGVGLLGVVLAVYLSRIGVGATGIGLVLGVGLFGACVATAVVMWASARIGRRASLVVLSLLAASGGVALAVAPSFPLLLFFAFVGMVNGMGTDRSAAFALEPAIIPGLVPDQSRTWGLSWYNVLLDGGGALGALGAGIPLAVSAWAHLDLIVAEDVRQVGLRDANSRVLHRNLHRVSSTLENEADAASRRGVLHGIVNEDQQQAS